MGDERLADLLARLEGERASADAAYQAALTALDRAVQSMPEIPHPPPIYDEQQITPINQAWDILPQGAPALDRSFKGRLRSFVWRMIGPALEQQKHFNAALVDHLNRNVAAHREAEKAIATLITLTRDHIAGVLQFQGYLIQYLQTITLYIDTKDRASGGQAQVLNAAISALSDDWQKRWETLTVREQRHDARVERYEARIASLPELREAVAIVQQTMLSLQRQFAQAIASRGGASEGAASAPISAPATADRRAAETVYVGFEDRFRGSQEDIRSRLTDYVPLFAGQENVLDVGCGRGEMLDLFREHGIDAHGIDINAEMIEICRARGLRAETADALGHLEAQPDASLGGLIAIQVVEHLEPSYLIAFIERACQKLRPGAAMVLETINAACWVAFFESYLRDLTHQRALHPDTLRYLVQAAGFASIEVWFRAPVPDADKLTPVRLLSAPGLEPDLRLVNVVETVNANADKLNARLFTHLDYAIVARR